MPCDLGKFATRFMGASFKKGWHHFYDILVRELRWTWVFVISRIIKVEVGVISRRPWLFWISQKLNLIIVLLYIEQILPFSLRHEMFSKFVPTLSFPQVLSVFSLSRNQQTAPLPPSSTFLCLWVLVFNYVFDVLLGQRSKPGSHVFASSLTASNTKRANLTWLPLEIMHRGHTWHDYPWPWVSLTWLLYNLQLDDVPGADFENSLYAFGQSEKR